MRSFFRLWLLPTALRTSPRALCSPPVMPDMVSQLWEKCDHKASFVFSYQPVTNRIRFLVCSQFLLFHSRKRRSDWPCVAGRDGPSVKREIGGRKAKASPSVTDREDKRWLVRFKLQLAVSERWWKELPNWAMSVAIQKITVMWKWVW